MDKPKFKTGDKVKIVGSNSKPWVTAMNEFLGQVVTITGVWDLFNPNIPQYIIEENCYVFPEDSLKSVLCDGNQLLLFEL